MWTGEAALRRQSWEDKVKQLLSGFAQVYTPYIYKKESHLKSWCGELSLEHGDYVLGHKGVCHYAMMCEGARSYRDLPERYYELSEVYTFDRGVQNHPGLYISVMCEPEHMHDLGGQIYVLFQRAADGLKLQNYHVRVGVASDPKYVSRSGRKREAGLILSRARFICEVNP